MGFFAVLPRRSRFEDTGAMEKNLVYVVAMAGLGSRFERAGYKIPKYMISAAGATLLEHSLLSLPLEPAKKIVFVALRLHQEWYGLEDFINSSLCRVAGGASLRPPLEIILIEAPTRGQAETVMRARPSVPAGSELAIYNIDTRFNSDTLLEKLSNREKKLDGVIGSFRLKDKDEKWSFARLGPDGAVDLTAEKKQISDNALTGLYHFTRAEDFFSAASEAFSSGDREAGEFYVAPLYNPLIAAGRKFVLDEARSMIPLGTPEDIERIALHGFTGR